MRQTDDASPKHAVGRVSIGRYIPRGVNGKKANANDRDEPYESSGVSRNARALLVWYVQTEIGSMFWPTEHMVALRLAVEPNARGSAMGNAHVFNSGIVLLRWLTPSQSVW